MSKKSLDEEREFCRSVYEKWDFIRRIVELYAEGVSWQGCDKLDTESIKDGMRDMLVSGVGQFTLKTQESVEVPMPRRSLAGRNSTRSSSTNRCTQSSLVL